MRITIPVLGFQRNGGYRVLSELASAWMRAGHEVCFLCPVADVPYYPTTGRVCYVDAQGAERSPGDMPSTLGRLSRLRALWAGLRRVAPTSDVVLANHALTSYPVAFAPAPKLGRFYYVQAYEPEYYAGYKSAKGYLFAFGTALTYHLPLTRIVNSPIYFRYLNLRASIAIPPGVDESLFHAPVTLRTIAAAGDDTPVTIGCIGRAEPEKGTAYVLQAFERLAARSTRFRLRIAAFAPLPGGWTHERLEAVRPGSDRELADYYRSVDILIAPGTVQHGAPHYPVLEAGACGAVVITTGYLGATADTAWLVENRSVDSIVDAVDAVMADPQEADRRRRRFLTVLEAFRWDRVGADFIATFLGRHDGKTA
jgi:glycosyltransferase involved in cell wall biosynthesis